MAFTLPNLPYAAAALEPYIDATTMEIHHGRHHKAYVDNLNKALEGQAALASKSIEQLLRDIKQVPDNIRKAVINNGGGHANHSMFWEIMGPGAGGKPSGPLADDINATFGDFATFQAQVKQAEADQIVTAMREKKIPVTYVLFPDEGHGFARPENNLAFYAVTEAFLARHLGGRYQPIGNDFADSSITCPDGESQIPGLAEAIQSMPAEHPPLPMP